METYININPNRETLVLLGAISIGVLGLIYYIKLSWKHYGMLFLMSAFIGNILCFLFVNFGFYTFPYRLLPKLSEMPIIAVTITFPLLVLVGVRYSPKPWPWKIPFYWTIIHVGIFLETIMLTGTRLIEYQFKWDLWDSYTWWWIYFLIFEWIGGMIVPEHLRKPLQIRHLTYGKIGWFLIHFILIITIFLGGYYLGLTQQ
ncbi:hypothetical protein LGQ02_03880 [Bacillus shivajii]|uniref:CBO0543 family protein n=1 Tax=Bacillus shivajii TaxID=1983719 RepID=UPI001CFB16EB|nr:CBO0543 family protein [Bacillus shivajii]UCZ53933.1 hypothetical protein LGQ02_03880 [Bacillus shivajii]